MSAKTPQIRAEYDLPELLQIAPKLLPVIDEFNNYRYFLLEGGRNGMKSQTIARLLLFLGDKRKLNIVCGREVQERIDESVYTLLAELIQQYSLPYRVMSNEIRHFTSGTVFSFRGFQDLSAEDIKGLQGVDILWVDEAQSLKNRTVKVIIPTIRKETAKVFFTMNRLLVSDPIYDEFSTRADCLHLYVTYMDNPWLPPNQLHEANLMKEKDPREYNHIWLGLPMAAGDDYLFNSEKLLQAFSIHAYGDLLKPARIMPVDFAAQGGDKCVATILDRITNVHWKVTAQIAWNEPDSMVSTGRIVDLIGQFKPDLPIIDSGGMGHVVADRITELGVYIERFDGGSTDHVDVKYYANQRAEGYYLTNEWVNNGWLVLDRKDEIISKQLERIRFKYRSNGQRLIRPKEEYKADHGISPDEADSVMMGVWAAQKLLGNTGKDFKSSSSRQIQRVTRSRHQIRI